MVGSMSALFPNTREVRFQAGNTEIFARVGGSGPPLLLLQGYPQTHAMWHRIAPQLMAQFTCVMPDLRGYGSRHAPIMIRRISPIRSAPWRAICGS